MNLSHERKIHFVAVRHLGIITFGYGRQCGHEHRHANVLLGVLAPTFWGVQSPKCNCWLLHNFTLLEELPHYHPQWFIHCPILSVLQGTSIATCFMEHFSYSCWWKSLFQNPRYVVIVPPRRCHQPTMAAIAFTLQISFSHAPLQTSSLFRDRCPLQVQGMNEIINQWME